MATNTKSKRVAKKPISPKQREKLIRRKLLRKSGDVAEHLTRKMK